MRFRKIRQQEKAQPKLQGITEREKVERNLCLLCAIILLPLLRYLALCALRVCVCVRVCVRPPGPGQMRGGEALTNARLPAGAPTSSRRSASAHCFGFFLPPSGTSSSRLLVKLPRLQNCVSSFSAANAAAATGGIRTASPHSMAAMPSSSRRCVSSFVFCGRPLLAQHPYLAVHMICEVQYKRLYTNEVFFFVCFFAVADAQNHSDSHPHLKVISSSIPQQRGGPESGDRAYHHPRLHRKGRGHRGAFADSPGRGLKPPTHPHRGLVCVTSFVRLFGSHRMSQMGTVRPRLWLRSAAAAPAASTLRLHQGAAWAVAIATAVADPTPSRPPTSL